MRLTASECPAQPLAIAAVESWVFAIAPDAERLSRTSLREYASRKAVAGWRLTIQFSDRARRLDLVVNAYFPREPPLVFIVDRPDFLTWPHVDNDGHLCLMSAGVEVDHTRPMFVCQAVLAAGCGLVEELIAGRQEDFRGEFLSYWSARVSPGAPYCYSLLNPESPSRKISVWRGQNYYLLGETDADLTHWLQNKSRQAKSPGQPEQALLLWLDQPMLPSEYPYTPTDLMSVAEKASPSATALLRNHLASQSSEVIVAVASPSLHGPCLAAVLLTLPQELSTRRGRARNSVQDGFRAGKLPSSLLTSRRLSAAHVLRSRVDRIDSDWIHGRGHDARHLQLKNATVGVIGCGSVGSSVAELLAESGVGGLLLVDPDEMKPANCGRHALGIAHVGQNKVEALADFVKSRYPHMSKVLAYSKRWEDVVAENDALNCCDVIMSATGSWTADGGLNEWRLRQNSRPIVFGWMESRACAGHAVAVLGSGGCLQCGFNATGTPLLRITEWPSTTGLHREPGCGALFEPYGPVELGHIVSLISELTLDCLLGRVGTSTHRVWVGKSSLLIEAGGTWSRAWGEIAVDRPKGAFLEELDWPRDPNCLSCGETCDD